MGAGEALTSFSLPIQPLRDWDPVESHAISSAAIQHVYDRVSPFTLFLEEGYSYRDQNRELPRLCAEAIGSVMFELAYRAPRRHPAAA